MDCILTALLTCLSWSNVYIETGLALHRQVPSAVSHGYDYWRYDITETRNPYGILEFGIEVPFKVSFMRGEVTTALAYRHESAITVNDFGTDSIQWTAKWRPFR